MWLTTAGIAMALGLGLGAACSPSGGWETRSAEPAEIGAVPASRRTNSGGGDALARGRGIYQQQCLSCHGTSGKGDGPKASQCARDPSDLSSPTVTGKSDQVLFRKISDGRTPMPAFRKLLTEQERLDVIRYIRTLAP